ncbi:MAG: hypothetical protein NZO58_04070, partial [Gemmataceae bacterium]|nr:hypothetical protein [Gemmataceae bacterium]
MKNGSAARAAKRRFVPGIERLETRDCPAAPTISASAYESGPTQFTVVGQVNDEEPGGLTVNFSGVYEGSVITNP